MKAEPTSSKVVFNVLQQNEMPLAAIFSEAQAREGRRKMLATPASCNVGVLTTGYAGVSRSYFTDTRAARVAIAAQ